MPQANINFSLTNKVFLVFLALVFFLLFFYIDFQNASIKLEVSREVIQTQGVARDTIDPDTLNGMVVATNDEPYELMFDGLDRLYVLPNSQIRIQEIVLNDGVYSGEVVIDSGSVWASNLSGVFKPSIFTSSSVVEPDKAIVAVEYNAGEHKIYTIKHASRVSLAKDNSILNSYVIPEKHSVNFFDSSISSAISQLQFTKLTKEFPPKLFSIATSQQSYQALLEQDISRYDNYFIDFLNSDIKKPRKLLGGTNLFDFLTINDSKKEKGKISDLLKSLSRAEYFASINNVNKTQNNITDFERQLTNINQSSSYSNRINLLNSNLFNRGLLYSNVLPGDSFHTVKRSLFSSAPTKELLRSSLNEIYDLFDGGEIALAQGALVEYHQLFTLYITQSDRDQDLRSFLTEEHFLLQELITSNESFFNTSSFELLSYLEQSILEISPSEYDLNEEMQSFIQSRIRVMSRLIEMIKTKSINNSVGVGLGRLLVMQSRDYLNSITKQVAVVDFFHSKLIEYDQIFSFFDDPEFANREGTFEQLLDEYSRKDEDLRNLEAYLSEVLSNDTAGEIPIGPDEALQIVRDELSSISLRYTNLYSLEDSNNRLFQIEGAFLGGVSFNAKYDRLTEMTYDVKTDDVEFTSGIKLGNLESTLSSYKSIDLLDDLQVDDEQTPDTQSLTERAALASVENSLRNAGVDVSDAEISIIDMASLLFNVSQAEFSDTGDIISFDYSQREDQILNLVLEKEGARSLLAENVNISQIGVLLKNND